MSDLTDRQHEILSKLRACLSDVMAASLDTPDAALLDKRLTDDLALDSLDRIELVVVIEDEFGIDDITNAELAAVVTVRDAVELIERKMA